MKPKDCDVLVVGAGNAALSSAFSAHEHGAKVLVLEKAPRSARGGNTRWAGGAYRFAHRGKEEILEFVPNLSPAEKEAIVVDPYTKDDFYVDLIRVTRGLADSELCKILVNESNAAVRWLTKLGLEWELWTEYCIRRGGKLYWQGKGAPPIKGKGAGEGIAETEARIAEGLGIPILYETKAVGLLVNDTGKVVGAKVRDKDGFREITCNAVVLGSGGFSANAEMRCKYLGPTWDTMKVRGTRYNTGETINMALELGAQPSGHWSGCHCSIVGAEQPPVEFGDAGNRYSYPFSIMVDEAAERFVDEGEDAVLLTYAKFGRTVLNRPHSIAFQIFDAKVKSLIMPFYESVKPIVANTIEELAKRLTVDPTKLQQTIEEYNKAVSNSTEFNPAEKDGKNTTGIDPPKSNWAQRIDTPPYLAYPVTGGLTFTFGGLKFDKNVQVLDTEGHPIPGLYAAGEIAGLFYYNYPGGSGLTRGTVFGRIAGAKAAQENE